MLSTASSIAELPREPDHRGLGGSVSHPSRTGAYAADGRDVDHPTSTALLHQRNSVLCRQQGSREVDRDCRVPPFELYLGQRRGAGDSGIVHQDIASTQLISEPRE
jgi:hypothetical protein